jgi:hypothetical protein
MDRVCHGDLLARSELSAGMGRPIWIEILGIGIGRYWHGNAAIKASVSRDIPGHNRFPAENSEPTTPPTSTHIW